MVGSQFLHLLTFITIPHLGGVDEREEGGVGLSGRESIGDRGVA